MVFVKPAVFWIGSLAWISSRLCFEQTDRHKWEKLALLVQVFGTLGKVFKTWQCGRSLFCFGMHACRYIHHFGKKKHITFSKQPVNMDCLSVLVCSFGRAQDFLLCFFLQDVSQKGKRPFAIQCSTCQKTEIQFGRPFFEQQCFCAKNRGNF